MPTKILRAAPFIPTTSRAGGESPAVFRAKNVLLRGRPPERLYLETYNGSRDLSENIPGATLTGTLTSTGDYTVTGTGTLFLTELHVGQIVIADDRVIVVNEILSNTLFQSVAPVSTSFAGMTGYLGPVLFEVNQKRGSLVFGNALQFDKGTILGVGSGTLRLNGTALSGTSFVAARTPKIATFDPTSGNYSVYSLGMATPVAPGLAAVAGGTKNMQAGLYSIRIVPARTATSGWNNPSPKVEVTIAAGQRIQITFPVMDTAKGQDSWRVYGTLYTANQGINGPWYYVQTITATDLGGTGAGTTFNVEWLDAEIGRNELLEFDNFAPGEAEFVASLGGNPVYISCFGRTGGAPGANLVPVKPRNIEAALINLNLRLDPAHTILGWTVALGRLYLMTVNSLQIATLQSVANFPITTRPFWKRGFHNPYSLVFVNGRLYGWTEAGPTRSASEGEEGSEEFAFGADVMEITKRWTDGKVYVAHDPVGEMVCFVHSADLLNDTTGFWSSVILPYSLQLEAWMPPIVLESTTGDMIVTGVATVGNRFYFIAGGRQSGGGLTWRTYEWNSRGVSTPTVPYYIAWQFADDGAEESLKRVKTCRITGIHTNAFIGIHGAEAGEEVNTSLLEQTSVGSKSGAIFIGSSMTLKRGERSGLNLPELALYTLRIEGQSFAVNADPDRIDEIALEVDVRRMRQ